MKKVKLGSSDLMVTEVCLGTMTWGQQNNQAQAFEQLDYATQCGINFVDTAELYSIPPNPQTYGATETIIGNWFAQNPDKREQVILASKSSGNGVPWIRDGGDITGDSVTKSIDENAERAGMLDILQALDEAIKAGKVRHIGLSDESPWGISEYLHLAEKHDLPRMVSIQNEFNLLHLKDSPYLIENCILNDVAYLPWSPIAGGALSGKYANGARPENCRWTMSQRHGIFRDTEQTHEAIAAYKVIADKHNLSLVQLSLAWVYQFTGVTSTIIGATSLAHLKENISAYDVALSDEVLAEVDAVIRRFPLPF